MEGLLKFISKPDGTFVSEVEPCEPIAARMRIMPYVLHTTC
jgi:hypothetical protein